MSPRWMRSSRVNVGMLSAAGVSGRQLEFLDDVVDRHCFYDGVRGNAERGDDTETRQCNQRGGNAMTDWELPYQVKQFLS